MATADIIAHQVTMYGEPLSVRFGRLLRGYGVSQSRLAAVIGLSPPMLSQLMSGQREKISNPAVLARVVRLEELLTSATVAGGEPGAVATLLDEVASSRPTLSTVQVPRTVASPAQRATLALAETLDAASLRAAAQRLEPGVLADILANAASTADEAGSGAGAGGRGRSAIAAGETGR